LIKVSASIFGHILRKNLQVLCQICLHIESTKSQQLHGKQQLEAAAAAGSKQHKQQQQASIKQHKQRSKKERKQQASSK
jgi:hypothetical protein